MSTRAELEQASRGIAERIKVGLPSGVGFTLIVFDFGVGGNLAYISTAQRADMVNTLKEMIVKLELDLPAEDSLS